MRILLVEDDPRIAHFLERGLTEEGHAVEHVRDLRAAREAHAMQAADLLLIDRGLPDGDGLSLIRALRAAGDDTPTICLTARDTVSDRVDGLNGGADDYLVKPFAFAELLARIASVTRRRRDLSATTLRVGPLRMEPESLRVFCNQRELSLTALEFRLLRYLLEHRGQICTRTRLLEAVWDTQHDPGTNVVDVYVSYLRAKLADAGAPALIHTVRGRGYLLDAATSRP